MTGFRTRIRRCLFGTLAILVTFSPAAVFANGPAQPVKTESAAVSEKKPTGADAHTYWYDEETGMWENEHYIWDPATGQTRPKKPQAYSYNPATGMWDTKEWRYDPATGTYVANTFSVKEKPAGAAVGQTTPTPTPTPTPSPESKPGDPATGPQDTDDPDATGEKPAAHQTDEAEDEAEAAAIHDTDGRHETHDLYYDASITNTITADALTGDATVTENGEAGSATSGNALSAQNVLNLLQSSWNPDGETPTTFVANVDGEVFGDLVIDPGRIAGDVGVEQKPAAAASLDINSETNASITNKLDVSAASGDATVDANTIAGDATTGTAHAVANVVNIINSAITSGKSFVGTLNINGNLDGDILLPPEVLQQLLALNAQPATLDTTAVENASLLADFETTHTINNDISLAARSGDATVEHNTSAGHAVSGDASTNLTVLNLTGRQVIGKNALLVFVNVLGQWVGMIMDAPGATSAAIGSGIRQNGAVLPSGDTTISSKANHTITNELDLRARSGDAAVTNNTKAGNATSGKATASANVLNITGSQLSLSDWFGILFINVFGKWHGSFGVNTAAGNPAVAAATGGSGAAGGSAPHEVRVFRFVPSESAHTSYRVEPASLTEAPSESSQDNNVSNESDSRVLGAMNKSDTPGGTGQTESKRTNWQIPIAGSLIGLILLAIERILSARESARLAFQKGKVYRAI